MLRLFKNPLPEEDYIQMRRLAVQLLSKQFDSKAGEWEKENDNNVPVLRKPSSKRTRRFSPKS